MKIQLDSEKKTIKIEGNVKLSDLVKHLESLLPKDSPCGYWKDYELECNTMITYWSNPIIIKEYTRPWWGENYTTCGLGSYAGTSTTINGNITMDSNFTNTCVYNLELN